MRQERVIGHGLQDHVVHQILKHLDERSESPSTIVQFLALPSFPKRRSEGRSVQSARFLFQQRHQFQHDLARDNAIFVDDGGRRRRRRWRRRRRPLFLRRRRGRSRGRRRRFCPAVVIIIIIHVTIIIVILIIMIFGGLFGETRREFVLNVGAAFRHARSKRAEAVVIARRLDGSRAVAAATPTVAAAVTPTTVEHGVKLRLILGVFIVLFSLLQFGDVFDVLGYDRHQIKLPVGLLNMYHLMHLFQQFVRRLVAETLE